ncbi:unnamed protein product [Lampetra planeri]
MASLYLFHNFLSTGAQSPGNAKLQIEVFGGSSRAEGANTTRGTPSGGRREPRLPRRSLHSERIGSSPPRSMARPPGGGTSLRSLGGAIRVTRSFIAVARSFALKRRQVGSSSPVHHCSLHRSSRKTSTRAGALHVTSSRGGGGGLRSGVWSRERRGTGNTARHSAARGDVGDARRSPPTETHRPAGVGGVVTASGASAWGAESGVSSRPRVSRLTASISRGGRCRVRRRQCRDFGGSRPASSSSSSTRFEPSSSCCRGPVPSFGQRHVVSGLCGQRQGLSSSCAGNLIFGRQLESPLTSAQAEARSWVNGTDGARRGRFGSAAPRERRICDRELPPWPGAGFLLLVVEAAALHHRHGVPGWPRRAWSPRRAACAPVARFRQQPEVDPRPCGTDRGGVTRARECGVPLSASFIFSLRSLSHAGTPCASARRPSGCGVNAALRLLPQLSVVRRKGLTVSRRSSLPRSCLLQQAQTKYEQQHPRGIGAKGGGTGSRPQLQHESAAGKRGRPRIVPEEEIPREGSPRVPSRVNPTGSGLCVRPRQSGRQVTLDSARRSQGPQGPFQRAQRDESGGDLASFTASRGYSGRCRERLILRPAKRVRPVVN